MTNGMLAAICIAYIAGVLFREADSDMAAFGVVVAIGILIFLAGAYFAT